MELSRRDFLRASSALLAAWGLKIPDALAADNSGPPVIWLQAQGCSGCSVSLLNSIYYMTVDSLLLNTINLKYHPTLMAAAGGDAVSVAQTLGKTKGFVLVIEGAVPTGAGGRYCYLWPGMTAMEAVRTYSANAGFVLAVGSCAAYGGMVGGSPNPTGVQPVSSLVSGRPVINIPGCPSHPDWIVGTVAYLIANGKAPSLDSKRRPRINNYFTRKLHEQCPYHDGTGERYCLKDFGCKGPETYADCSTRKWNSGAAGTNGVNWCIGPGWPSGTPCHGCTEPGFPDAMSPFYREGSDDAPSEAAFRAQSQTGSAPVGDTATSPSTANPLPTEQPAGAASGSTADDDDEMLKELFPEWHKRKAYQKRAKERETLKKLLERAPKRSSP